MKEGHSEDLYAARPFAGEFFNFQIRPMMCRLAENISAILSVTIIFLQGGVMKLMAYEGFKNKFITFDDAFLVRVSANQNSSA